MKRALVALIAGTILSGFAAAYASTSSIASNDRNRPNKNDTLESKAQKLAASD